MNEYVKKLTTSLEPLIEDLDEKLTVLNEKKEKFESVSKFLSYVKDDVNLVGIYADQDLILEHLANVDSDKNEYVASCYLLKSEDESVKALPQYKKAYSFVENLINYFKDCKEKLNTEILELEDVCAEKKLDKKYYELFSKENPFVTDVSEFTSFLEKRALDDEQRINMLIYTINSNMLAYTGKKN